MVAVRNTLTAGPKTRKLGEPNSPNSSMIACFVQYSFAAGFLSPAASVPRPTENDR